jgi:hypothetical protein
MQRVITSFGKIVDRERKLPDSVSNSKLLTNVKFLPLKTKMLAWWIFLIFFIEAGTMGLLPRSFYFVYRNVRLSDILLYMLTVYSLFCVKEYQDLYKSKSFLIIKYLFCICYSILNKHYCL